MKTHRVNFILSTATLRKRRLVWGVERHIYSAFDVKELVILHNRSGYSDVTHNIICAEAQRFYSDVPSIMALNGCDLYPHESP